MAQQIEDSVGQDDPPARPRRRILRRIVGILLLLLFFALAAAWIWREEIADSFIKDQLDQLGLEASYDIDSIGPRRQVLTNIVVGDPEHPDLTIERVETSLVPRWPFAGIGRLRLVEPRLYGTYVDGQMSFGALDPLLFPEKTDEPATFPDMVLILEDARALIESDHGAIGIKLEGEGNLQDGFSARLAAVAPQLSFEGCEARDVTLLGDVLVDAERPGFDGPLRLGSLECPASDLALSDVTLAVDALLDRSLDGIEGRAQFSGGESRLGENSASGFEGDAQFSWREDALTSSYYLVATDIAVPQLLAERLELNGSARTREGFERLEIEANVTGNGVMPGPSVNLALANAAEAASSTLAAPLLDRFQTGLARETRGSEFVAGLTLRRSQEELSLVVPEANWRGASGATLLALSRFQFTEQDGGMGRFSGNFSTGGRDMPQISGRMESSADATETELRLRMAEYSAASSSLAIPELTLIQSRDGSLRIDGDLQASGPIPGGTVTKLALPLSGTYSNGGVLDFWRDCTDLEFETLKLSSLELGRHKLGLCPNEGEAIVHSDGEEFRIAAAMPELQIDGLLSETPIHISGATVKLNLPEGLVAENLTVLLGSEGFENRFEIGELTLDPALGLGGTFARTDTFLNSVPIDVLSASGNWRYAFERLTLNRASLRIRDRLPQQEMKEDDVEREDDHARFEPLIAREAWLRLDGNLITANARLRHPRSDILVTTASITHDLGTGSGRAELDFGQLEFGRNLQPDTLSYYALGLVANAEGVIEGSGTIEWDSENLTSHGEFSTESLDFAAAFGPVDGLSGTITFTDLLGMVTEKDQVLHVRSFNPGIQVEEGSLTYELQPDYLMVIHGGSWPFIGGTLEVEPTSTYLDRAEPRRYTLKLTGIDAAQFVQQLEFGNIAASGRFNGRVPLVFDKDGGRIEKGQLTSLPPGGNLSYLGLLQYEDMGAITNFAFQALKSLDFTEMDVFLDGSLAGDIVTQVRFEGIRQGAGTRQNVVTRQLARLPIRFNVNITAPFQELISLPSKLSGAALAMDLRDLGLLDENGNPIQRSTPEPTVIIRPEDPPQGDTGDEADIQGPESEN